ncbi:uncharacterized protein LOC130594130 [Pezoporus wallicus]|uniref:uncharacterized protein LOC130594130 n=1 Tax=Pezoporus wallicus TaxID=35540 RepID=UPI00254A9336|nr:uncharacterized protein LOC130594130 [Pezoporus wallicus]
MSKKFKFPKESSKICVAFYKKPGQYQEFAVLKERKKYLQGQATIPISHVQGETIFYKYAILKSMLSTDHERSCDLEYICGMDSKNTGQLHRVLNIPKEEIKASGTWTIFENMKCYFNEKKTNILELFKLQSPKKMPQNTVNCGIIEYLTDEFSKTIKLKKSFNNLERKLKIYTESFKIYLGDAANGKTYSPTDLEDHQLKTNMIKFMDKIVGHLETEEQKDNGLLFALHTSFCYNIQLSKEVIVKAEKLFQDIGPFQDKFQHLRGRSDYISALKKICLDNEDDVLCIWLIPLLYAITEKMEGPFSIQTVPSQRLLQLRDDEKKQKKVLEMIKIHKSFIESCSPLAKTVLEMLALKNFTTESLLQIKLPPVVLLDTVYNRIIKIALEPAQVHVWHELSLLNILCAKWTKKWQSLIHNMVERWLEKVNGRELLDFYSEFIEKDKYWNTGLEICFTDCVIQRIKHLPKSEVHSFCLNATITSCKLGVSTSCHTELTHFASCAYLAYGGLIEWETNLV